MSRQQNRFSFVFALCAIIAASVASAEVREVSTVDELKTALAELSKATDEIVIAASPTPYVLDSTLTFLGGVKVRGSTENPRDTVLDGDGKYRVFDARNGGVIRNLTVSNGYYVATANSDGAAGYAGAASKGCVVSNCVITCCHTDGSAKNGRGAGAAICTIYDSVICGNRATGAKGSGGGVFNATVYRCDIFGNHADNLGGGVLSSTLYGCNVYGNDSNVSGGGCAGMEDYFLYVYDHTVVSNNVAGGHGGGIDKAKIVADSDIVFNEAAVSKSSANVDGGGISRSTLVTNCLIRGNAVTGTSKTRMGGAVYDCVLRKCRIFDNFIEGGDGAAVVKGKLYDCVLSNNCADARSTLRGVYASNCTFYGTSVDASGSENLVSGFDHCRFLNFSTTKNGKLLPGMNVAGEGDFNGPVTMVLINANNTSLDCRFAATNCLFAENSVGQNLLEKRASFGMELVNCTFVDNACKQTIRGKYNDTDACEGTKFINTVFYRNCNLSGDSTDFNSDGAGMTFDHCLFGPAGKTKEGNTVIDPVYLTVNQDIRFDTTNAADPYSLQRKSPAIGKGLYQDWMASATDLKGDPRAHEDSTVAIGCYECWIPAPGLMLLLR